MDGTEYTTKKETPEGERFLKWLAESGNVSEACRASGVCRKTAYNWRDADPEFAKAWADAIQQSNDALEAEARRRAMSTSDTLMIFLLKGNLPEKYRDTIRQEISGPGGGPVKTQAVVTPDDLETVPTEELRAIEQQILDAVARGRAANAVPPQPA